MKSSRLFLFIQALACLLGCSPSPAVQVISDAGTDASTPSAIAPPVVQPIVFAEGHASKPPLPTYTHSPSMDANDHTLAACTGPKGQWMCSLPKKQAFATGQLPAVPPSWSVPYWAFDPAKSASCASDTNNCTSATCGAAGVGPCATLGQIIVRWGTTQPLLRQETTIQQLSDDAPPWPNVWSLAPRSYGSLASPYGFVVSGTLLPQATATIGAYTPRNHAAGTKGTITASDQSGAYWTPYVGMLVQDTTAGADFWIDSDLGGATAAITSPMAPAVPYGTAAPPYVTIANGDGLNISRPTKAYCHDFGGGLFSYTSVYHMQCSGTAPSALSYVPTLIIESMIDTNTSFNNCPLQAQTGEFVTNSFLAGSFEITGVFLGGAIASLDSTLGCGSSANELIVDGDILIDQRQHISKNVVLGVGSAYFGGPGNIHTYSSFSTIDIGLWNASGLYYGSAAMWGSEAADMSNGTSLFCEENCTKNILLTGGMTMEQGLTTAYPWLADAGTWGSTLLSLTPANVDTYGAMCRPPLRDCFYSHQLP